MISQCTEFYFSVVSAKSGEDLVFGNNPVFKRIKEEIVLCIETPIDGEVCSSSSGIIAFGKDKVNNKDVLNILMCDGADTGGKWSNVRLTISDTTNYQIDYKLLEPEKFYSLAPEYYFEELYIDGVLQCAPCEPEHVTIFEIDI